MGSQPESKLSRKIMAALRDEGWFVFKIHGGPTMLTGLPDIICCADGLFIGLETKMPDKRGNVSVAQAHVHDQIRQANGLCEVVCSPTEAVGIVEQALAARAFARRR